MAKVSTPLTHRNPRKAVRFILRGRSISIVAATGRNPQKGRSDRFERKINEEVNPRHWNKKTCRVTSSDPMALSKNARLEHEERRLKDIIDALKKKHRVITPAMVEREWDKEANDNESLLAFCEMFIRNARAGRIKHNRTNKDLSTGYIDSMVVVYNGLWKYHSNSEGEEIRKRLYRYRILGKERKIKGPISPLYIQRYIDLAAEGKLLLHNEKLPQEELQWLIATAEELRSRPGKVELWNANDWYPMLIDQMRDDGYSGNTLADYAKHINRWLTEAGAEFDPMPVKYEKADAIALTEAEMQLWINAEVPEHLQQDQDRFIVAYDLCQRYSDSINIAPGNIIYLGDVPCVDFRQVKTGGTNVVPLKPRSLELLKKYNYAFPERPYQQTWKNLSEIGKLAGIDQPVIHKGRSVPKYTRITTHTSRRSAATNMYLAGMDLEMIRKIGGWENIEMLKTYIRVDELENARLAAAHPFFK